MQFLDIAKTRYSCRNYKPNDVDDKELMLVLEAARIAPSAVNYQPWDFIVIKTKKKKDKIYEAYPREWLKTAPVIIVVCGNHTQSWKRNDKKDHLDIDIAIAIDHMTLQATEIGLATCWVCNFNLALLKKNLILPEHIEPIAVIPIGYPNDQSDPLRHEVKRKSKSEIIHWENF